MTNTDLQIIVDVCKLMNSAMHYDPILEKIMEFSTQVMDVEGASVLLHDDTIDKLIFHLATGDRSENLKKVVLNPDEGIAGWVYRNNKPLVCNDLTHDGRFANRVDSSVDFVTRSILAVPLTHEQKVIGVFELVNKKSDAGFTDRDLALSEGIAAQVALTLERIRLINENMTVNRLATIGETVTGLAHYIKNILTGLDGTKHIIGTALRNDEFGRIHKLWPVLENSIHKISSLTLDMLEFSKDRRPDYTLKNINDVVREIFELCEKKAASQNTTLRIECDKMIPASYFDATGIFRCLLNMITNSLDACMRIPQPVITIATQLDDDHIIITVTDNGCGMPADVIEKILLSKFFSTKGSRGTGLGVPVIRKIVNEHMGTLSILSKENEGTTFRIRIPVLTEPPEEPFIHGEETQ